MSNEKKVRNSNYIFLCSNIRARETRLLDAERMQKMVEAPSYDEAVKYLIDCDYPDMTGMDEIEIERTIAGHRKQIVFELSRFCPEPIMLDAFRLRYDYHNIKVLVKSHGEAGNAEHLMSSCGLVEPDRLAECYRTEEYDMLPDYIRDCMREARAVLARTGDPQRTDFGIDRAYHAQMLVMASQLSDDFLYEYIRWCIDGANLRSTVRALRIGLDVATLQSALIPGGHVETYMITDAAAGERDLAFLFYAGPLQKAGEMGVEAIGGASLTAFESECENALTRYLDKAKYVSIGPAPVLAFLDGLDNEIIAIRTILLAKKYGMSEDMLRERLRESYV